MLLHDDEKVRPMLDMIIEIAKKRAAILESMKQALLGGDTNFALEYA
ncbi:hypothetical protein DSCO28_60070 [Desulfosarcina ovata subsp. sediminis]|uniref:Uncharacterized protein n=1 Tax=Desulfosarcina ovata subsp. sediminis TaxID=885957 RepID=A0A5K7ZZ75_9BACT|nr:hypothetical protein [Desulfosarcina ovata]BBO85441.1 hypothetical protein DSCO28_60070 [Desulfosarcina ovata subsp. sediminis]